MRHYCSTAGLHRTSAAAGLYLVATPIGNLRDITLRALEVLAAADLIACEDTRVTRKLLDHYGIATPLTPYHDHNAAHARPKLLARLAEGAAVALVSDAGTPLVSDPGFKLVREARAAGHAVTALPGASAVLAALTVAACRPTGFSSKASCRRKRERGARVSPKSCGFRRRWWCSQPVRVSPRCLPILRRGSAGARARSAGS